MSKLIKEQGEHGRLHIDTPMMGESLVSKEFLKRTESNEYFRVHPDINVLKIGGQSIMDRGRETLARIIRPVPEAAETDADEAPAAVVCVSGSLAHVYFTGTDRALHLEEIRALYPGLVEALSCHPGIGLVAVTREFGDAVAICQDGLRNLITGELAGARDPLAPFADRHRWANELATLLGYERSGDLIINGAWLPERGRIVVLEEQSSSHGGLGGLQTEPFLMAPTSWDLTFRDLESPEALHGLIRRQLARYRP